MSKGIQGIKGIKRSENIDRNCKIFHVTRKLAKEKDFFWNHQHYSFFMKVLAKYLESVGGRLVYFCIMPTHYHLIVYVPNYEMLAEVMRHVDLSFSKHLYHKEKTLGSVWVGKLWSRGICDDKDLFDTMKYLYDNPERAHIDQPENYRKSSAHECASYFRQNCYTDRPFLERLTGKSLVEIRQFMRQPHPLFDNSVDNEFSRMSDDAMAKKYFINPSIGNPKMR